MAKEDLWLPVVTLIAVVLLGLFVVFKAPVQVNNVDTAALASAILAGLPETDLDGIYKELDVIKAELAEIQDEGVSEEAKAKELVLAEFDTRDFKKAVWTALNGYYNKTSNWSLNSTPIESWRDITDLVVKDLDIEYDEDDEEANVTVDMKVYYFIDGDEDEEEKARIEFEVKVTDLDEDENFIDAEVDEDYLENIEVRKVY